MNNIAILKKCLTELSKEDFRKDYVVGMLETLIEMQEVPFTKEIHLTSDQLIPIRIPVLPSDPSKEVDEGAMLDATAKAALEQTKELAAKSHG